MCCVFFFRQKTAYEVRISDWSSDVCSSDLQARRVLDRLLDRLQERHRLAAVDQPMVIAEREIHHRADHDLAVADGRAILDAVEAETRRLRRVSRKHVGKGKRGTVSVEPGGRSNSNKKTGGGRGGRGI